LEIDKELVKKLRKEGKEERYIAWMLGVEEKDLPPVEEEATEFKEGADIES
jgi:hypothetical protein